MTEGNQKNRLSSQMNIKTMHLAVPKHGVIVIIDIVSINQKSCLVANTNITVTSIVSLK